jgi:hypothetical protein
MPQLIRESVGKEGKNKQPDVKVVIDLLNVALPRMGKPQLADPNRLLDGIFSFQMHHFGVATGRVAPDDVTINKLNEVALGAMVPGLPQAFTGLVPAYRDAIVNVARYEAERNDHVTGPDPANDRQSPEGAKRLKEYFQVLPESLGWQPAEFEKGKPGGRAWCGIFATWVLTQLKIPVQWGINEDNVWGMIWTSLDVTGTKKIRVNEDRYYAKGDICLVTEPGVAEKFPTHHFIVAEDPDPSKGTMATIEGNYFDRGSGRRHSVTKNTRVIQKYPHYCPFQPAEM